MMVVFSHEVLTSADPSTTHCITIILEVANCFTKNFLQKNAELNPFLPWADALPLFLINCLITVFGSVE